MKHVYLTLLLLLPLISFSQSNNNGQLDNITEFSTKTTIPITMPDGVDLMTDITLPITSDSLTVDIDLGGLGNNTIILIPKGIQIIYYDSIDGGINPNPFQVPMVMTRTPYGKGDITGSVFALMGYGHAEQDMRGRYDSEGVYLPMYSDSWSKAPYHSYQHILDITAPNDPANANNHEDGYNSIQYLVNDFKKDFDFDYDGTPDLINQKVCNGSFGMFGASALGNTQYQAAAAYPINPYGPGLKCLLPIVATNEHYRYTGFQNGVFRQSIVTGWVKGQLFDTDDDLNALDNDLQNDMHSSTDYGVPDKYIAADNGVDHFTTIKYDANITSYYPNAAGRADMDASRAMVDANGEGAANGQNSRYTNMEVPAYHLTGWWDIFTDGQIATWQYMRDNLDPSHGNKTLQKIVIGPWSHQTIGAVENGDLIYKENVTDVIGFDIGNVDFNDLDLALLLDSEVVKWFRYNMNYGYTNIGEPKVRIPESTLYQEFGAGTYIKVPASDFIIPFDDLLRYLAGQGSLDGLQISLHLGPNLGYQEIASLTVDVPVVGDPILEGTPSGPIGAPEYLDFNSIPNFRAYIVGPVDDGVPSNLNAGNYWLSSDEFPLQSGITWVDYYLHQSGEINNIAQSSDEGSRSYIHDPDNPVITVGGANMIVRTPQNDRDSQGQMNLADPDFIDYTMNHPGVLQFQTQILADTFSIVGFPEATLYASSLPQGAANGDLTDSDFMVRVLDVYPDGREFFVVEGTVNARAKAFALSLLEGNEDDDALFENINSGQVYEYKFQLMPIGYTFGIGHRMKVLISSSSFPRYQSNPNLPIEAGDFFRRSPGDGQIYNFQGDDMAPRIADNQIHFSDQYPSSLRLPVFGQTYLLDTKDEEAETLTSAISIQPNPAQSFIDLQVDLASDNYQLSIHDLNGRLVMEQSNFEITKGQTQRISLTGLAVGSYILKLKSGLDYHSEKFVIMR